MPSSKRKQRNFESDIKEHKMFLNLWQYHIAYVYMFICVADFVLFPILWGILQLAEKGDITIMWSPITLTNAGLFHLSFGAILGVSANSKNRSLLEESQDDEFDADILPDDDDDIPVREVLPDATGPIVRAGRFSLRGFFSFLKPFRHHPLISKIINPFHAIIRKRK